MTEQKSLKIRTKVRAGQLTLNHSARPMKPRTKVRAAANNGNHNARPAKKLDAKLVKLAAKRVRGTKTGVRAGRTFECYCEKMTAKWV